MILKDSTPIDFKDKNLGAIVKNLLRKDQITADDMLKIEKLDIQEAGIKNIDGLQYAKNLRVLNANENEIEDIVPLLGLKKIVDINIPHNKIKTIFGIESLKNLRSLNITFNEIQDMSPIASLKTLTNIWLCRNPMQVFFLPLENCTQVTYLEIFNKTDINKQLTRYQRRLLDDVFYSPSTETITRILLLTPAVIPLVRRTIGEDELFRIVVKRVQDDTIPAEYLKHLIEYSIDNISGKEIIVHYGSKNAKSLLTKILFTEKGLQQEALDQQD